MSGCHIITELEKIIFVLYVERSFLFRILRDQVEVQSGYTNTELVIEICMPAVIAVIEKLKQ